jgi:flavin-dependent dehydrogenase
MQQEIRADGVIAVGDAGNMIEELLGGGAINAVFAGKEAGISVAEAVQANDFSKEFLQNYQTRCDKVVGERIQRMSMLRKLVYSSAENIKKYIAYCNEKHGDDIIDDLSASIEYVQYMTAQQKQLKQQ